jgi:hypothetical protein
MGHKTGVTEKVTDAICARAANAKTDAILKLARAIIVDAARSATRSLNARTRHYWILRICFSFSARMKSGSGMKCTASRYFDVLPPSGELAHSRKSRIALATSLSG